MYKTKIIKKNLTSMLLIAFLLTAFLPIISSCGGDSDNERYPIGVTAATQATEEISTELTHGVPRLDFEGYEFRWLTSTTTSTYCITAVTEQTGDVLNDAMYDRIKKVEDELGVVFAPDIIPGESEAALSLMRNTVFAGEDAFDAAMQLGRAAFGMIGSGLFVDFKTLPYITTGTQWWFNEINDQVNLTDKNFVMFGSLNMGIYDFTNAILFNKNMLSSLNLENPYELVDSGKWTFDVCAEMAKAAVQDANGDGQMTKDDIWGFAGRSNSLLPNFIAGARQRMVEIDSDGIPRLTAGSNERIFEVFDRVMTLFRDDGVWYTKTGTENNYYVKCPFFENDQALFADRSFYSLTQLREMESDFGMVPFPKFDEVQEQYGAMVEAGGRATIVPVTIKDPEVVGAVLEALNFYGWKDVIPVYFEIALKQKYTRDNEASRMFDLILDSIIYDLGDTMLCSTVKDGILVPLFTGNKRDLASKIEAQMPKVEAAIQAAMGN